jgi:phage shock protein A
LNGNLSEKIDYLVNRVHELETKIKNLTNSKYGMKARKKK